MTLQSIAADDQAATMQCCTRRAPRRDQNTGLQQSYIMQKTHDEGVRSPIGRRSSRTYMVLQARSSRARKEQGDENPLLSTRCRHRLSRAGPGRPRPAGQSSSGSARALRPMAGQRRTGASDRHGSIPPRVIASEVVEKSVAGQVLWRCLATDATTPRPVSPES